jgi:hypothetical protein
MRAATPLTDEEFLLANESNELPEWKRVPNSDEVKPFEDKPTDFGRLDGRIVVMDYAAESRLTHRCVDPYTDEHARTPVYENDFE